jgi:hypothetical protein
VTDVLTAATYLRRRFDVDSNRVRLEGHGLESGLIALLASACSGIPVAKAEGTIESFGHVLEVGTGRPAIFVPGLLRVADVPQIRRLATIEKD